jgi:cytochrome c
MRRTSLAALVGVTLLGVTAPAVAQDAAKGADVYQDRCSACHVLNGIGQGPSLVGVVGRKAASLQGFNYSDAMKASGLTWTPANLDRFLSGPTKLVPGHARDRRRSERSARPDRLSGLIEALTPARQARWTSVTL